MELLGKSIDLFQDNVPPEPKTIEDLPTSVPESILANSTKKERVQEPRDVTREALRGAEFWKSPNHISAGVKLD